MSESNLLRVFLVVFGNSVNMLASQYFNLGMLSALENTISSLLLVLEGVKTAYI